MAYFYRGPQSPREEQQVPIYTNPLSPQRNPNRLSGSMASASSIRNGLTRRFTTNNELPPTALSPIGQQRKQAAGDYTPAGRMKMAPSEDRVRHYEQLLREQRQIQAELAQVDPETRREVEQGLRHEEHIAAMMASSEPASPPPADYGSAFPTAFSKPNRYSNASLTSVPGISNRPSRSNTQMTSPSAGFARPYTSGGIHLPSQSVPGSRRQSDDEEDDDTFMYGFENGVHRAAANPNRNSMPVTGYSRKRNTTDFSSYGQANITSFSYDEDEDFHRSSKSNTTSPPTAKTYLQVQQTVDGFPKLIRREDNIELSSSALDLAFARGVEPQQQLADRATASRHRISLPPSALSGNFTIAPLNRIMANADSMSPAVNRRSTEVKFSTEIKRPSLMAPPLQAMANGITQKTLSSYSTNDIPTLRSINGGPSSGPATAITSPSRQSIGLVDVSSPENTISRITSIASSSNNNIDRQSQDFSLALNQQDSSNDLTAAVNSGLQANAAPFGPMGNTHDSPMQNGQNGMSPYAQPPYFQPGYNMQMLNNGFGNMNVGGYGGQPQWPAQMNMYGQPNGYGGYQQFGQNGQANAGAGRFPDNQRALTQQRRQAQEDAQARFNQVTVNQLTGEIYGLCKDQHGCRFLQRKLDQRADDSVQIIFEEVKEHIIELMTDPFGNYLCQKLLECANDKQRTALITNAAPAMTKIALNQHGTRALQKMIEHISTPEQTDVMIEALRFDVVQLIQDLNGNHVIQKCLNHLSPENAQFIFDAVGVHCVTVGTHRHGCCVLQRCIDHATGLQKGGLVDQVIKNAFALVQDPFGNYVVQYILDLGEPCFTEPLCRSFYGQIAYLSKQKFSSNVIEKCIRCSTHDTKRVLINEIAVPQELDKLLRDSFANYVVQTAMDFADDEAKSFLIESIRPILPAIRHTPYGRRIMTKIGEYDAQMSASSSADPSGAPSGVATPADQLSPPTMSRNLNGAVNGTSPYASQTVPSGGRGNRNGWAGPPPQWNGIDNNVAAFTNNNNFAPNGYGNHDTPHSDISSPTPQRHGHSNSMFAGEPHAYASPTFSGREPAAFNRF
ncbi:hypothetical protein LTS02_013069 [Friedmanniomyces endolithicus]|nr:hypothetical protein LTR94_016018 [Friedmanniomyces endolithicus]KAK0776456.1 hypothetical protein LTR59_014188 [Friedmanniomyces endolithicus]KAK0782007.1 hypothetical protein LTR38_013547 [Friedmanniomyces endolithicus]KAK0836552.1 hypothetical protein LTR03_013565 [Friedmanniomyces endolithicus]KAK0850769.1 hypothetical protein LTS02_013069 [Friedmanniomyces endolithicus]